MHSTPNPSDQSIGELIPITTNDGEVQAVMGRDLHGFLDSKEPYTRWIARHVEKYGFSAGQDFMTEMSESTGGRPSEDHILTMDMAKELAMLQGNAKGKQARQYFIEVEKRAREQAPALPDRRALAQMVIEAEDRAAEQEQRARALEAPAKSWQVLAHSAGDYSVSQAAKVLSRDPEIRIGRDQLFKYMHQIGWIFRTRGHRAHWEASQGKAMNTGRLSHKPGKPFLNEKTGEMENSNPTVRVTLKGLGELHQLLGGAEELGVEKAAA